MNIEGKILQISYLKICFAIHDVMSFSLCTSSWPWRTPMTATATTPNQIGFRVGGGLEGSGGRWGFPRFSGKVVGSEGLMVGGRHKRVVPKRRERWGWMGVFGCHWRWGQGKWEGLGSRGALTDGSKIWNENLSLSPPPPFQKKKTWNDSPGFVCCSRGQMPSPPPPPIRPKHGNGFQLDAFCSKVNAFWVCDW